jgi:hypothetical protein
MANFIEELWNSVFTPGPTPTLLIATNAAFAGLQFLLLILLIATYSIHFVVLSVLCGGLWYSINWFAAEVAREQQAQKANEKRKSPETENASDTEREGSPAPPSTEPTTAATTSADAAQPIIHDSPKQVSQASLEPQMAASIDALRRRRSLGESSGYISTDSEWEKVSEGEDKSK